MDGRESRDGPGTKGLDLSGRDHLSFTVPAEQANGVTSVVEIRVAPGWLAPPHRHEREVGVDLDH